MEDVQDPEALHKVIKELAHFRDQAARIAAKSPDDSDETILAKLRENMWASNALKDVQHALERAEMNRR